MLVIVWMAMLAVSFVFFFFKQKTAYEMLRSLVGSEMCIRDRSDTDTAYQGVRIIFLDTEPSNWSFDPVRGQYFCCLLYTSDAADDLLCVDLGGRRSIKKKKRFDRTSRSER